MGFTALGLWACDVGTVVGGDGMGGGSGGGGSAMGGTGGSGGSGGCGGAGTLPADINSVLNNSCRSCHGSPPSGGAPMSLVTLSDLTAMSALYPGQTQADRCLARMQDMTSPMPPGLPGAAGGAAVTSFQNWISGGLQPAPCGSDTDAGFDPFSVTQCTSMQYYSFGDGSRMEPGNACIACHSQYSGTEAPPLYFAAGTVYDTGHEPSRCYGVNVSGAQVVFTDANGNTTPVNVNTAGNFTLLTSLAGPFHVKVVYNGMERAMSAAPPSGDCNTCHTATGDQSAPGRIVLPAP
jgi:hypothetical protein